MHACMRPARMCDAKGGPHPTPAEVRAELSRIDVSQKDLAKVLNTTSFSISQWLNHEAKRKNSQSLTAAVTKWYSQSVGSSSRTGAKRKRADTSAGTNSSEEEGKEKLQGKKQKQRRTRRAAKRQERKDQEDEMDEDEDNEMERAEDTSGDDVEDQEDDGEGVQAQGAKQIVADSGAQRETDDGDDDDSDNSDDDNMKHSEAQDSDQDARSRNSQNSGGNEQCVWVQARENELLSSIAKRCGMHWRALADLNRSEYGELRPSSRFKRGTELRTEQSDCVDDTDLTPLIRELEVLEEDGQWKLAKLYKLKSYDAEDCRGYVLYFGDSEWEGLGGDYTMDKSGVLRDSDNTVIETRAPLRRGSRVEVRPQVGAKGVRSEVSAHWQTGKVERVNMNGTYDVLLSSGTRLSRLSAKQVRATQGMRTEANETGSQRDADDGDDDDSDNSDDDNMKHSEAQDSDQDARSRNSQNSGGNEQCVWVQARENELLSSIAKRCGMHWRALADLNRSEYGELRPSSRFKRGTELRTEQSDCADGEFAADDEISRRYVGLEEKQHGMWRVRFCFERQRYNVGCFRSRVQAANEYDRARLKLGPPMPGGRRPTLNFARAAWADTLYPRTQEADKEEVEQEKGEQEESEQEEGEQQKDEQREGEQEEDEEDEEDEDEQEEGEQEEQVYEKQQQDATQQEREAGQSQDQTREVNGICSDIDGEGTSDGGAADAGGETILKDEDFVELAYLKVLEPDGSWRPAQLLRYREGHNPLRGKAVPNSGAVLWFGDKEYEGLDGDYTASQDEGGVWTVLDGDGDVVHTQPDTTHTTQGASASATCGSAVPEGPTVTIATTAAAGSSTTVNVDPPPAGAGSDMLAARTSAIAVSTSGAAAEVAVDDAIAGADADALGAQLQSSTRLLSGRTKDEEKGAEKLREIESKVIRLENTTGKATAVTFELREGFRRRCWMATIECDNGDVVQRPFKEVQRQLESKRRSDAPPQLVRAPMQASPGLIAPEPVSPASFAAPTQSSVTGSCVYELSEAGTWSEISNTLSVARPRAQAHGQAPVSESELSQEHAHACVQACAAQGAGQKRYAEVVADEERRRTDILLAFQRAEAETEKIKQQKIAHIADLAAREAEAKVDELISREQEHKAWLQAERKLEEQCRDEAVLARNEAEAQEEEARRCNEEEAAAVAKSKHDLAVAEKERDDANAAMSATAKRILDQEEAIRLAEAEKQKAEQARHAAEQALREAEQAVRDAEAMICQGREAKSAAENEHSRLEKSAGDAGAAISSAREVLDRFTGPGTVTPSAAATASAQALRKKVDEIEAAAAARFQATAEAIDRAAQKANERKKAETDAANLRERQYEAGNLAHIAMIELVATKEGMLLGNNDFDCL